MGTVQLGNITEFVEQFTVASDPVIRRYIRADCDEYAGVAAFLSTNPGTVVLPAHHPVDPRWWEVVAETLAWPGLSVIDLPVASDESFSDVVARDAGLMAVITRALDEGARLLAWGETPQFHRLAEPFDLVKAPRSTDRTIHTRLESKVTSVGFLEQAAAMCGTRIRIPRSTVHASDVELVAGMLDGTGNGASIVLKCEFGAGGFGTQVVAPDWLVSEQTCRRFLAALRITDSGFASWPIIVQQHVFPDVAGQSPRDLTVDGEVDANGKVQLRGASQMLVSDTYYGGAVTSPLPMPADLYRELAEFGLAVGELLSAAGYRGWFDVDFAQGLNGSLYALEINARHTGPIIAYTVGAQLRALRPEGGDAVACADAFPLPTRVSSADLFEIFRRETAPLDWVVVPTMFRANEGMRPTLGFAVQGPNVDSAAARLHETADRIGRALLGVLPRPVDEPPVPKVRM